jgi:hypothetical protein
MNRGLSDFYMSTALRYGKVEVLPGGVLYSAEAIKAMRLKGRAFIEPGFTPPVSYHGVSA